MITGLAVVIPFKVGYIFVEMILPIFIYKSMTFAHDIKQWRIKGGIFSRFPGFSDFFGCVTYIYKIPLLPPFKLNPQYATDNEPEGGS